MPNRNVPKGHIIANPKLYTYNGGLINTIFLVSASLTLLLCVFASKYFISSAMANTCKHLKMHLFLSALPLFHHPSKPSHLQNPLMAQSILKVLVTLFGISLIYVAFPEFSLIVFSSAICSSISLSFAFKCILQNGFGHSSYIVILSKTFLQFRFQNTHHFPVKARNCICKNRNGELNVLGRLAKRL